MKFEGYGCEFDAKYFGGPADGLERNVVVFSSDIPPKVTYLEVNNVVGSRRPLGEGLLRPTRTKPTARVGVYKLENEPSTYSEEDDLIYHFIETMNYDEYIKKYTEPE